MRCVIDLVGDDPGYADVPRVISMDVLPRRGDEFCLGDADGFTLYVRHVSLVISKADPSGMAVPPPVSAYMVLSASRPA